MTADVTPGDGSGAQLAPRSSASDSGRVLAISPRSKQRFDRGPEEEVAPLIDLKPLRVWAGFALRSVRRSPLRALIVGIPALLVGLLLFASGTPTYASNAVLSARTSSLSGGVLNPNPSGATGGQLTDAAGTIHSQASLDTIIDKVGLIEHRDQALPPLASLKKRLFSPLSGSSPDSAARGELRADLRRTILVVPDLANETLSIYVNWPNAADAPAIVDQAAKNFLDARRQVDVTPIENAVTILQSSVADATKEVARLREEQGLTPTQQPVFGGELASAITRQAGLQDQLQQAQLKLESANADFNVRYETMTPTTAAVPTGSAKIGYLMALVFAFLSAVGFCTFRDVRRGRVVEPWQLEEQLKVRHLGTIPVHALRKSAAAEPSPATTAAKKPGTDTTRRSKSREVEEPGALQPEVLRRGGVAEMDRPRARLDAQAGLSLERLWFALPEGWTSIAVVPVDDRSSSVALASRLRQAGHRIESRNITTMRTDGTRGTVIEDALDTIAKAAVDDGRVLVTTDQPLERPAALRVCRAAQYDLLTVTLGQTRIEDVKDLVAAIGPERVTGAATVDLHSGKGLRRRQGKS